MRSLVHVISDLHLGGAPASDAGRGFQMCPPATHVLLEKFIDSLPASSLALDSHLVIAGDIVDFLAEVPFEAFTGDPKVACEKLQRIFDSTAVFWDALQRFAEDRGGVVTLMLGNHDIELSLPGVRQMLLERVGGARVAFIYDNEAFTLGPLLIEHGNRFDAWNAVPHGELRRVRSQLSRKLPVKPEFPALPGSRLVVDVMNPLKRDYPFIDLLKPEDAAALPIAMALGGVGLKQIWHGFAKFRDSWAVDHDEATGEPKNPNLIRGAVDPDLEMWTAAQRIGFGGDGQQVGAFSDAVHGLGAAAADKLRKEKIDSLYGAFRKIASMRRLHRDAFDPSKEVETYLVPARRSAAAGFKVVVYGHTHLPKRIALGTAGAPDALYLNTGTWADVMCIPDGIWDEDEAKGRELFRHFVDDLKGNTLARWRRSMPTFARIAIDGDDIVSAELRFADNDALVDTEAILKRLGPKAQYD